MKLNVKPLFLAIALASSGATAPTVTASGFPVVDIASIAQSVTEYMQDLLAYEEYMQQTITAASQLDEAIRLYEQTMISYNHMLRQMTELKNRIDRKDWMGVYAKYERIINRYPGSSPSYDPVWRQAREKVDTVYYQGNEQAELEAQLDQIDYDLASRERALASISRARTRADTGVSQSLEVDAYDEMTVEYTETLRKLDDQRAALGAEDHLATLQLMADQQHVSLQMMQQQMLQQNSNLKFANQLEQHVFSKEQRAQEANIKMQQVRANETYTVNEDPLSQW
ncbi:hypothetical protein [Stutzerimonas kunmingensis]|uniref:hypothetical protein n=1 Tax=Stutzerimonas kunmingensis TaxID=1211807 RepID=UPI0028A881B2|nr:hypothetical protein [Stutzerimonas kunmingensis]